MFLINKFKNLNYNFLYSTMQKSFITGLRLKNNLTNQLVQPIILRNNFNQGMAGMSSGIHVVRPYTLTVIWVMQGNSFITQKLYLQ